MAAGGAPAIGVWVAVGKAVGDGKGVMLGVRLGVKVGDGVMVSVGGRPVGVNVIWVGVAEG